MTAQDQILTDLLIGQSTAGALAERMATDEQAVSTICDRMARDGLLEQTKIAACLTVWRLTDDGRAVAGPLSPQVAANPFTTA